MTNPHEKDLRILDQVAAVCRPQDASALRRIGDRLVELENQQPVPDGWRTELKQIADTLDHDGDEHGCAVRIYGLLKRDQVTAPAVPDGWKLVPIEHTAEMTESICGGYEVSPYLVGLFWRNMLAASPQPPSDQFANKRAEIERDMARGARITDHRFAIDVPQPPAVSDDKAEPDYKTLFHRAVSDIALIEEALGIPEDESGKSAQYLAEAAAELRRQVFSYESMVADRDELLAKRDLDAERYRIARDSFGVSQVNLAICEFEDQSGGLGAYLPMNPDDADAAIDAMQEIKK